MAAPLRLDRPLVVLDLETTGVNIHEDRIVEVALVTLGPDGSRSSRSWLVNPGCPIPASATAVHGIADADVADAPGFGEVAPELLAALEGVDLSGFNAERFDIPLLTREFSRVGVVFPTSDVAILDTHTIFVRREPRDLAAAVRLYCGRSHEGAHRATADAEAAADVLLAQLERYADLPRDARALHQHLHPVDPSWIDAEGKLAWYRGEAVINFGSKHRQRSLRELVASDPGFLRWVLGRDFPADTQAIIAEALEGRFPATR